MFICSAPPDVEQSGKMHAHGNYQDVFFFSKSHMVWHCMSYAASERACCKCNVPIALLWHAKFTCTLYPFSTLGTIKLSHANMPAKNYLQLKINLHMGLQFCYLESIACLQQVKCGMNLNYTDVASLNPCRPLLSNRHALRPVAL